MPVLVYGLYHMEYVLCYTKVIIDYNVSKLKEVANQLIQQIITNYKPVWAHLSPSLCLDREPNQELAAMCRTWHAHHQHIKTK